MDFSIARKIWKSGGRVDMYSTARGTWSVRASYGLSWPHKTRLKTQLTYEEALVEHKLAWEWLRENV